MCTAITFETSDKIRFLARTMDFSFQLSAEPIYIPRDYTFNSQIKDSEFKGPYAFIGAGRDMKGYLFADGVNEKGFGIATLYFEQNAQFSKRKNAKKLNISAEEVVSWALSNVSSISDFEKKLKDINIMEHTNSVLNKSLPLHWIVSDETGKSKVLEITKDGINIYDNPVGVMTNSPIFPWHLTNLGHYNTFKPSEYEPKTYGNYITKSDGPGNGLTGMPGDFTSTSRFVRSAVLRQYSEPVTGVEQGVNVVKHILNSVDIPKGVKITNVKNNTSDFTQYKGILDLSNRSYYMLPYDSNVMRKFSLTSTLLERKEPVVLPMLPDSKLMSLLDKLGDIIPGNVDWATMLSVIKKIKQV